MMGDLLVIDASNYGIGAVISHVMNDCQKRPIVWAYTYPYHQSQIIVGNFQSQKRPL